MEIGEDESKDKSQFRIWRNIGLKLKVRWKYVKVEIEFKVDLI